MYEEYLLDANDFYETGKKYMSIDAKQSKKYFRASTFYLFSVIDGYMNFIVDEYASLLPEDFSDFISDKKLRFSLTKYSMEKVIEYHSVKQKLKLLIHHFLPDYDFGLSEWGDLMQLKKLRDEVVHPKDDIDNIDLISYEETIGKGLKSIVSVLNKLSQKIFNRSLRRTLLDLLN